MFDIPILYPTGFLENINFIYDSYDDIIQIGKDNINYVDFLPKRHKLFLYHDSFLNSIDKRDVIIPRNFWQFEMLKNSLINLNWAWNWIYCYPFSEDLDYKIEYLGHFIEFDKKNLNFKMREGFTQKSLYQCINLSERTLLHHDYVTNYIFAHNFYFPKDFLINKNNLNGFFLVYYEHFNNLEIVIQASFSYWLELILPPYRLNLAADLNNTFQIPSLAWESSAYRPIKPIKLLKYVDYDFMTNKSTWTSIRRRIESLDVNNLYKNIYKDI